MFHSSNDYYHSCVPPPFLAKKAIYFCRLSGRVVLKFPFCGLMKLK